MNNKADSLLLTPFSGELPALSHGWNQVGLHIYIKLSKYKSIITNKLFNKIVIRCVVICLLLLYYSYDFQLIDTTVINIMLFTFGFFHRNCSVF